MSNAQANVVSLQYIVETAAGTFSTWFLGSPENNENNVEFHIDNIRFVEL